MQGLCQFLVKCLFILLAAALVVTNARHHKDYALDDNNQLNDMEPNQPGSGLKPWQMEMLAQKVALAELQNNNQVGFQRELRSDMNRRNKALPCFFNPVTCFKK